MENIKKIFNLIFEEKATKDDFHYIEKYIEDNEKTAISLFREGFIKNNNINSIRIAFSNIDEFEPTSNFIIKYELFRAIIDNYLSDCKYADIFQLLSERSDFMARVPYMISDLDPSAIINFIENLCKHNKNLNLKDEYFYFLAKIIPSYKLYKDLLCSINCSILYHVHVIASQDQLYDILWKAVDSIISGNIENRQYRQYLEIKFDTDPELLNNLDNYHLITIYSSNLLWLCLYNCKILSCEKALNKLIDRSVAEKNSKMLLKASVNLTDKEILGKLLKIGDPQAIKQFVASSKNKKEINDLMLYY